MRALRDAASHSRVLRRLSLAGARADTALLADTAAALLPEHKAPPSGAHLWQQGIHTPFTLRFAGPLLAAAAWSEIANSVHRHAAQPDDDRSAAGRQHMLRDHRAGSRPHRVLPDVALLVR